MQQPAHALGNVVLPWPSVFRPGRQSARQLRGSCVLHNHIRVRRHSWSLRTHAHRLLSAHWLVRLLLKRPLLRTNTGCGEVGVVRRGVCTIAECAASRGQTNLSVRRRRIHSTGPQHAMEPSLEAKARLVTQTTARWPWKLTLRTIGRPYFTRPRLAPVAPPGDRDCTPAPLLRRPPVDPNSESTSLYSLILPGFSPVLHVDDALCTHEASGDPRQTMTGRQPVQRKQGTKLLTSSTTG